MPQHHKPSSMSLDKFLNNRSRCEIVLGRRIRTNEPRKEKNIIRRKLRKTLRRSKITQSSLFNRGRWALNCGEMTFLREFCSPLYFLGQMLSLSILKNPKFGNRHMNGQATLHFFYFLRSAKNRKSSFRTEDGTFSPPSPGEICTTCSHRVPLHLTTSPAPPLLLIGLLISALCDSKGFRRHIQS